MEVLFEDNHLIVINKTGSDLVQGDKTGDQTLADKVKIYIKQKYDKPGEVFLGITHRLDRPVSGIVIFARTSKALTRMNEMFRDKTIEKTYWAIVKNRPMNLEKTLIHYMRKDEAKNKSAAYDRELVDTKRAELSYRLIASVTNYHLLEVSLKTGRHHQIRCQLSKIGSTIKGDLKYGFPRSNPDGGISLHARKVTFIHPVTKITVEIIAPPPSDNLWNDFVKLVG